MNVSGVVYRIQVQVTLQPSVSQSVRRGLGPLWN